MAKSYESSGLPRGPPNDLRGEGRNKFFEDSEERLVWAFFINPLPEFFQAIFGIPKN